MSEFIVVGGGGREQCLVEILLKRDDVYSIGGSDRIRQLAPPLDKGEKIDLSKPLSEELLVKITKRREALVIVGPELPLAVGWVDQILKKNPSQRVLGPTGEKAQLESSKWWGKQLLQKYNIPTGRAVRIENRKEASSALSEFSPPHVIKADGLAGGKGVALFQQPEQALHFVGEILEGNLFGAQKACLIEEYLAGQELSLFLLMDGQMSVQIGAARDYKRLKDGNRGPNTGGMGAYSPLDLEKKDWDLLYRQVVWPLLDALKRENLLYRGFLYLGLIRGQDGFKVLEFNVRLGDPESQVILPLLGDSLGQLLFWAGEGRLAELAEKSELLRPDFWVCPSGGVAVCAVLSAPNYPLSPTREIPLPHLEDHLKSNHSECYIFQGGTQKKGEQWFASSGRILNVVALHSNLQGARQKCYEIIEQMNYPELHYRRDIGLLTDAE